MTRPAPVPHTSTHTLYAIARRAGAAIVIGMAVGVAMGVWMTLAATPASAAQTGVQGGVQTEVQTEMQATDTAPPWRNIVQPALPSATGDFRFAGFLIYTAQLWSSRLPPSGDAPFALQLTYARSLSRDRLVWSSVDEMQRIASAHGATVPADTLARWRTDMSRAFVDVAAGDRITGVYLPGQGASFYAGERLTARIDDPAFARAFFSIWLDPATRSPALRERLLSAQP